MNKAVIIIIALFLSGCASNGNGDNIPDECQDLREETQQAASIGSTDRKFDFNCDGQVSIADIAIAAAAFEQCKLPVRDCTRDH